jgi:outer membrane protein assembly factor BamB
VKRTVIIAIALTVLMLTRVSATDQWPQFRGVQAGVADDDPALPDRWNETENVVWKADVPGLAWSSPVVWGDHVFLTSAVSSGAETPPTKGLFDPLGDLGSEKSSAVHRWMVYDFDFKTGAIRWQRELHSALPTIRKQIKNSYASETPVTDGEHVYVYWGSIGLLAALDMDGHPVWTKELGAFETNQGWGMAVSPVLYKDRVYVLNDNRMQSFIAAFDKRTGQEAWRTSRDDRETYSTPIVWENGLRAEIVTQGRTKFRSYGLDGGLLWELTATASSPIATPLARQGLLYISSGYPGSALRPVYAIRPGASGDISLKPGEASNEFIVWSQPLLASYQASALIYGDYFYTLLDRGFLLCHNAGTGRQMYGRQRVSAEASGFGASPWAYNGKIFLLSEDGDTFVVQAGPEFKVLGKNPLNEMVLATPAIARGSLFIRTQSHLYRIGRKTQ